MPLAVDNIEQVKIAMLLGVIFSGNLNFDEHVTFVLSICSQRLYLIKLHRSQGMTESKLHVIFVALIISRILYALSAWGGFLNSQQINRINAFLRKARRFGLCSSMCLCDCQSISDWLDVDCLIVYKVFPIASYICLHYKSTSAYVLEVTVTLSPFAQTSFANTLSYHEAYFLSFVFFSFTVFDSQCFILLYNICVCHLFNKEISPPSSCYSLKNQ